MGNQASIKRSESIYQRCSRPGSTALGVFDSEATVRLGLAPAQRTRQLRPGRHARACPNDSSSTRTISLSVPIKPTGASRVCWQLSMSLLGSPLVSKWSCHVLILGVQSDNTNFRPHCCLNSLCTFSELLWTPLVVHRLHSLEVPASASLVTRYCRSFQTQV